jgi:hypothetical protein
MERKELGGTPYNPRVKRDGLAEDFIENLAGKLILLM